jgi:MFS transporter, OFA family, oxalate/formate antiporter
MSNTNRWGLAAAGFLMQMALGAVYAWSVFRIPLAKQFHWSISEVTLTFTICAFCAGVAAFFGGLWLNKKGSARGRADRRVSLWPGRLSGKLFRDKLWWLYLSYGLIGGIGWDLATLFRLPCW